MKFYKTLARDTPTDTSDRLSRLLTFDLRVQFSFDGGMGAVLSLVLFGHGLTLIISRGMPYIVGGVYVEVNALTERFRAAAGYRPEWYANYIGGLFDNPDSGPIIRTAPVDIDDATRKPCCVHQDYTCTDECQLCEEGCCPPSSDDIRLAPEAAPIIRRSGGAGRATKVTFRAATYGCGIARHQEIGCDTACSGRRA